MAPSNPRRPPLPPSLDVVSVVLVELDEITRSGHRDTALRIGRVVFERIFGGDPATMRSGTKHPAYEALAADHRLPLSASTLWRNVAIFELVTRLPHIATAHHLGVAHLRAVLGLPHAQQERLLIAAAAERWTKDRLETESARVRSRRTDGRGRPRTPDIVRLIESVSRAASRIDESDLAQSAATLDNPSALRLGAKLRELRDLVDTVARILKERDSAPERTSTTLTLVAQRRASAG